MPDNTEHSPSSRKSWWVADPDQPPLSDAAFTRRHREELPRIVEHHVGYVPEEFGVHFFMSSTKTAPQSPGLGYSFGRKSWGFAGAEMAKRHEALSLIDFESIGL